jgi:integrase
MTKNGTSRTVPLSTRAVEILKALPRSLKGQVFPVSSNALKLGFSRAVKRARALYEANGGTDVHMLVDLHFHDLRHVAITRLAEKLPNLVELASVSGHQDVRMLKRYYHPRAEDLARKLG